MGGAAGGGKTWSLLVEPLRHINNPHFGAVIFRRTFKQVTMEGGLWDESGKLYPAFGACSNETDLDWTFPIGARVKFAHLQLERNKYDWMGAQVPFIGYDQLEHFSEDTFFYMLSRNRSLCGVRPYVRATCNPDADSWLATFLAWWIDQETGQAIAERSGVVRWVARINEELVWGDSRAELVEWVGPDADPKSVTFIPADIYDNPILLAKDPSYLANLKMLPLVERERLLNGNWKIRPAAGKVFNRGWFEIVDAVPAGGEEVRFFDFAATEKKLAGDDPDATASTKMRRVNGIYYILDCTNDHLGPAAIDPFVKNLAGQDVLAAQAQGAGYRVRWEVEPGAAAKKENVRMITMLAGLNAAGKLSREDKVTRAQPFARQAEAGNVKLVRGPWNEMLLKQLHGFPDLPHDDMVDSSSGAFNELTGARWLIS